MTCAIARISPDGGVALASAGHPSPFLLGREWTVPPGLPLGVTAEASYEEAVDHLAPGEALVLVSDGVVEAENAQRELFGFERTRKISTKSAHEIAEAAKGLGPDRRHHRSYSSENAMKHLLWFDAGPPNFLVR